MRSTRSRLVIGALTLVVLASLTAVVALRRSGDHGPDQAASSATNAAAPGSATSTAPATTTVATLLPTGSSPTEPSGPAPPSGPFAAPTPGGPPTSTGPSASSAPTTPPPTGQHRTAAQADDDPGPTVTYPAPPTGPCAGSSGDVVITYNGAGSSPRCVNASGGQNLVARNQSNEEIAFHFDVVMETLPPGAELNLGPLNRLAEGSGSKVFWISNHPEASGRVNVG